LVTIAESLDTASAAGRLVLNIMTTVSQWEREAIGEREAMSHKKGKGQRVGTVPFGYRLGGEGVHLDEEPAEQRVLARIGELRTAGLSLRAVANELNQHGIRTRLGTEWRFQYVGPVPVRCVRALRKSADEILGASEDAGPALRSS
jgi:DNA invertase Pin-like site-specific DNA recombinase